MMENRQIDYHRHALNREREINIEETLNDEKSKIFRLAAQKMIRKEIIESGRTAQRKLNKLIKQSKRANITAGQPHFELLKTKQTSPSGFVVMNFK